MEKENNNQNHFRILKMRSISSGLRISYSMIYILSIALFFNVQGALSGENPENKESGVIFYDGTWQQALDKAKAENKLIFLDAYASWCGPCKLMKARVFPNEEVGSYFNNNFINVKFDMEKGEGRILASTYNVKAYPSLLFIDYNGNVKRKAIGYHTSDELIKLGHNVLK